MVGAWLSTQRKTRRLGYMPAEHARALESVPGWQWSWDRAARREELWEEKLDLLRGFVAERGRLPRNSEPFRGFMVGNWTYAQRFSRRRGQLSEERVRKLEATPGWSWL